MGKKAIKPQKKAVRKSPKKKTAKRAVRNKSIKKRSSAIESRDEIFYVGLRNPKEFRRNILESAKDVITSLQAYEKFREIRSVKESALEELRADVKDIKSQLNKAKRLLPRTKLRFKHDLTLEKKELRDIEEKYGNKRKKRSQKEKDKKKSKKRIVKAKPSKPSKDVKTTPAEIKKEASPRKELKKPLTGLEKLEAELGDIEKKLERF